jgi:hypothetical protein
VPRWQFSTVILVVTAVFQAPLVTGDKLVPSMGSVIRPCEVPFGWPSFTATSWLAALGTIVVGVKYCCRDFNIMLPPLEGRGAAGRIHGMVAGWPLQRL